MSLSAGLIAGQNLSAISQLQNRTRGAKWSEWLLIPKTIGNRKGDCAWGLGCARGINTTWENLQIEKHKSGRRAFRPPNWFVLLDLQIFSGGIYPPSATLRTISFFYFQLFLVLIWFIFRWEEGRCSRKFDCLFRCFNPLSRHLTEAKRRRRTLSKSATYLATENVNELSAIQEGRTKMQIFGMEKCKTFRQY